MIGQVWKPGTVKLLTSMESTCSKSANIQTLQNYLSLVSSVLKECQDVKSKIWDQQLKEKARKTIEELFDKQLELSEMISTHNNQQDRTEKLPKVTIRNFDSQNPAVWFQDLEVQMDALSVTKESSRFAILNGLLGAEQSLVIYPITQDKTNPKPYDAAKKLLLNSFLMSIDQRLEKAFALQLDLEEEKPSQFLARFQILCDKADMNDVQKWFIKRSLPDDVRLTLENDSTLKTSKDLVQAADVLIQTKQFHSIQVIQPKRNEFQPQFQRFKPKLCWYHEKFGKRATKCDGSSALPCPMSNVLAKTPENFKDRQ